MAVQALPPGNIQTRRAAARPAWNIESIPATRMLWLALLGFAAWAALTHVGELGHIGRLLIHSDPRFLALALAGEALLFLNLGLFYGTTYRASGLNVSLPRSVLLGIGAHFINLVSKTAGLGGMALFLREGDRVGFSRQRGILAYLLTSVLGHIAYFATLGLALVLLYLRGGLGPQETVPAAALVVVAVLVFVVSLFALQRQDRVARIYRFAARLANGVAGRFGRGPWLAEARMEPAATDLYESARSARQRPWRYTAPLAFATAAEFLGVGILYAVGLALHAGISIQVAVAAYALTVLFSTVAFTPGGLGLVEASLTFFLVSMHVPPRTAVAVALSYRLFEFWIPFAAGLIALKFLGPARTDSRGPAKVDPRPMTVAERRSRSRAVSALAAAVGVLNIVLAMMPAPLLGSVEDMTPRLALEGSRFALLLLGMVLLGSAWSLSHGKRAAWATALAAAVLSVIAHPLKHLDLAGAALSGGLVVVLLMSASVFRARSDPPTAARGGLILVGAVLLTLAYGTTGIFFLDQEFGRTIPLGASFLESARITFFLPRAGLIPATGHGAWLINSIHVFFGASVLLALSRLMHPVVHRAVAGRHERERARALLEARGDSALAFFALLPDKSYFFSDSGRSMLAYRVVGNTAVIMGDPIGEEGEFAGLLAEFEEHCDLEGRTFALHQASPRWLPLYRSLGLRAAKIGEEAVLELGDFSLRGTRVKHLRAAMNRLEREGYTIEMLEPPLDEETLRALRSVSDEWLSQPGRRERTFTLGQFDDGYLRESRVMVVRDAVDAIVAFANVIPSYRSDQGNFDLLRYRREPKALADALYVSLALWFQERGFAGMNLGLAPFAGLEDENGAAVERAMRLLYRHGESLFRYRGLREFKDKFGPRWEPRYLVYRSDLQLPGLALAVGRAGEIGGRRRRRQHAQSPPPAPALEPAC